jgi:glycosidase
VAIVRPSLRAVALLLLSIAAPAGAQNTHARAPVHAAPAWSRSAVIYEVNVRQFTPEGTFVALEKHLPRLAALGVDVLWLMPVQPIGKLNRKGTLGSYYSISNYTAVNPEYGSEADFKQFVAAAHQHGMKVILDWVANHTAFDNPWTTEHKDYYLLRRDGSISVPLDENGKETDWTDVAQLQFANRAVWRAMTSAMRWWVTNTGIDGFRQDHADGPPKAFWDFARASIDSVRPGLFWLAESEDPKLQADFEATYGWELHHLLNDVAEGKKSTTALDAYFARDEQRFPRAAYRMYFTSNHDENSWAGTEFERMGENNRPAYVLCATAEQSFPLLYTGQEASLHKRLRFFEKDTVDWRDTSAVPFYRALFELKHRDTLLWNGAFGAAQRKLRTSGGERVYAFTRSRGAHSIVVAVNFGDAPARVSYTRLPDPGAYVDWFSREHLELESNGTLDIPAHGYRVLVTGGT